jgi:hypothetical protein
VAELEEVVQALEGGADGLMERPLGIDGMDEMHGTRHGGFVRVRR